MEQTFTTIKESSIVEAAYRNEILFWKVFKNICLFKLIIEKIHTTDWISYDDYNDINVNNRIKFKYIYSLEWMISNKQFQLLKYKIKSNSTDEYIEITRDGIKKLFQLSRYQDNGGEAMVNEFKEIFTLLMVYRKLELDSVVPSLIDLSIESGSLEAFKLLLGEPFNFKVLPSTIELIISNWNIDILKLVMDNLDHQNINNNSCKQIIICEETKLKSLYLASRSENPNGMIELILGYPQLYIEHPIVQQPPINSESLPKIEAITFLSIDPLEIQQKLLNLNCVQLENDISLLNQQSELLQKPTITTTTSCKFDSLERILIYFKLFKSNEKDNGGTFQMEIESILNQPMSVQYNKVKELHKLLVLSFKSAQLIYKEYLNLYDELIDEMFETTKEITIQYCCDSLNTNLFKLLSPEKMKKINLFNFQTMLPATRISQFIKKFIKQPIDSNTDDIVKLIVQKIISSIHSKQDYQLIMESIPIDCKLFLDQLPNEWNPLLSNIKNYASVREHIIKDNETVDWLLKHTTEDNMYLGTLKIINGSGRTNEPLVNIHEFGYANIETLIYFHYKSNSYNGGDSTSIPKSLDAGILGLIDLKLLSKQQIIELLNQIKPKDNINEDDFNFPIFISSVLGRLFNGDDGDDDINIKDIKIDFNSNVNGSYRLFVTYISEYNFKLVQYMLANFNIKCNLNQFQEICTRELTGRYSNELYKGNGVCTIESIHYQNIFKFIQLFSDFILGGDNGGSESTGSDSEFKSIIGLIIRYLYNRSIQIQGITIEKVFEIRNLIQPLNMKLDHSLYHSFHYINIKSKKLIKYVMDRPYLNDYLESKGYDTYYEMINDGSVDINFQEEDEDINHVPTFKISSYLHANEFTFEYLFGNGNNGNGGGASFDHILEKLIHHLSHTPIDQLIPRVNQNSGDYDIKLSQGYLSIKLNADLEYCLDIRRIDLFFKQLQFIQSLYDEGIRVGSFPNSSDLTINDIGDKTNQTKQQQYHFKFSSLVISKIIPLFDSGSISKLFVFNNGGDENLEIAFNRDYFVLENKLFEALFKGNNSKRIDLIDFIFNNLRAQPANYWYKLMETNQLYTIEHLINNYSNDLFEMKPKESDRAVMFTWKFITNIASESAMESNKMASYFKLAKNQQYFHEFKQLPSELQKIFRSDLVLPISNRDKELLDLASQSRLNELTSTINNLLNSRSFNPISFRCALIKFCFQRTPSTNYENDNIFTRSFSNGFIKLSLLIISNYNCLLFNSSVNFCNDDNDNQVFKISKQLITDTIAKGNINIIKYYYENTDYITDDNDLLLHLENEFHKDYKYLNWLQTTPTHKKFKK